MSFGSGLDMESKSELYIKASKAYASYCCLAILAAGSTAHLIYHRFDLI